MKKLLVPIALLFSVVAASAALPQPDLIAQIYFAGVQKIDASPNVGAFANEFSSPSAVALREQTATKLSAWLAGWLNTNCSVNVPDGATRLRPLFDDLQKSEWLLEARLVGGKPDVALAIKLDAARAQVWQAGLKPFLPAATFKSSGGWMIFDSSTASPGIGAALAHDVLLPHTGWLDLDVSWPCLARWNPELAKLGLPETQLAVTAPDSNFHVDGNLYYPQPLSLNLETWKTPVDELHEPISSFTAVRGIANWLQSQDWARPYLPVPAPNQAFIWATKGMPYQTYAAVPVPNAASALQQLYFSLEAKLSVPQPGNPMSSRFYLLRTNTQVTLLGLPFEAPYFKSESGKSGQYLLFGGFPNMRGPAASTDLLKQLQQSNLVFYHWEHTGERVSEMLEPLQMSLMMSGHMQIDGNSAAFRWLTNSAPRFDNTATKITQSAPDRLTFDRFGPGLFTAVEFYALASWLEARNFPGWDLSVPPLRRARHVHAAAPGAAPAPVAPK